MGIVADDIQRVKEVADFLQVAGEHTSLRRVGNRYAGLCPFHAEKTPSFYVNLADKLYMCFGCGAKGDIIRFVEETQHLEFRDAVEWLAAKFGVTLRYDDAAGGAEHRRRARLLEAMEAATAFYHDRLLSGSDAGSARGYLRSRGYDREIVERFRLGWAPDEWDALARHLKLPADVLEGAGLGFVNRRQRQQDQFRARVMFPICDVAGRPIAFGGRVLPGAEGSKYKNSAETALYHKSRTLYALNWAKDDIARRGEVVVCEGYTDVIAFFQAGLPRAVATCGTALADEHFRVLSSFAPRIVLAFDADAAGQGAAARVYEWERKYSADVFVAAMPPGSDPADLVRRDPTALGAAVLGAKPFLAFRLERVLASADTATAEGRARAAGQAVAVIREHPNDLVRDQYVMEVADRCRVSPERLRAMLDQPLGGDGATPREPRRPALTPTRRQAERHVAGPELEVLRLLAHRRDEVVARLDEALFADELARAAYLALAENESLSAAISNGRPDAADLLYRLAVEEPSSDPDDVVRRLVRVAADRALGALQARVRGGDTELQEHIVWAKPVAEQLDDPYAGPEAEAHLVAWLVQIAGKGE